MGFVGQLRQNFPSEVLDEADIKLLASDLSDDACHSAVARALRSGDLVRLKRGVYLFGPDYRRVAVSLFSVAARLYAPSYISFYSALSHHGLIPEAVYTTTSACYQNRRKAFQTVLGLFSYRAVPESVFRLGIESVRTNAGSYLIANPIKALFDLVYAEAKHVDSISLLEDDLRMNMDGLAESVRAQSYQDLEQLALAYGKRRCELLGRTLAKEYL